MSKIKPMTHKKRIELIMKPIVINVIKSQVNSCSKGPGIITNGYEFSNIGMK